MEKFTPVQSPDFAPVDIDSVVASNLFKNEPIPLPKEDKLAAYLRIRPVAGYDPSDGPYLINNDSLITKPPEGSQAAKVLKDNKTGVRQFQFNHIFREDVTQEQFYEKTALPMTTRLLRGDSSLLFAYGTTNSGKTFTMRGNNNNPGIIPRAINDIFAALGDRIDPTPRVRPLRFMEFDVLDENAILSESNVSTIISNSIRSKTSSCNSLKSLNSMMSESNINVSSSLLSNVAPGPCKYNVWISFVEFYLDSVKDLLSTESKTRAAPQILLINDGQENFYVKGCRRVCVGSAQEAYETLIYGWDNLHRASTVLNKDSSRSHCIFSISLVAFEERGILRPVPTSLSHLSFCDLAGSERGDRTQNTGQRIKEAGKINSSLMSLSRCISALRYNQRFPNRPKKLVPFRDSLLTKFFQSYFNGNGVASMVININPTPDYYDETLVTLQFSADASDLTMVTNQELKESFNRLTQVWMQSTHRWSSFAATKAKLMPHEMSTILMADDAVRPDSRQQVINEEEEEDEDYSEADLTADELTHIGSQLEEMDGTDPAALQLLKDQIDFLTERLKAHESEKFECEMKIRREVGEELKRIRAKAQEEKQAAINRAKEEKLKEINRHTDRFKSRLEERESQIKKLKENISKLESELRVKDERIYSLEQKINNLDQSLFQAQERACDKSYMKQTQEVELVELRNEVNQLKESISKSTKEKDEKIMELEKELKQRGKECKDLEKENKKLLKENEKLTNENQTVNSKLTAVLNERDELIVEIEKAKVEEDTPERKNILQQLQDISALKSAENSLINLNSFVSPDGGLMSEKSISEKLMNGKVKVDMIDTSMNTSLTGNVINEPKIKETCEQGTATNGTSVNDMNTSAIQVDVSSARTSTTNLQPPPPVVVDGICSPIKEVSTLKSESDSDKESNCKDIKKVERQLKETQTLLAMKQQQNQDLQKRLESVQRDLANAKKASSLKIPMLSEVFAAKPNGVKSTQSLDASRSGRTSAQGMCPPPSVNQSCKSQSNGEDETEPIQIGRNKRKIEQVSKSPTQYLDQLQKDENEMVSREKRSKSALLSDSTEDEIGILCMSADDSKADDDDEDEDEICQPIKKVRTRARREKKPKKPHCCQTTRKKLPIKETNLNLTMSPINKSQRDQDTSEMSLDITSTARKLRPRAKTSTSGVDVQAKKRLFESKSRKY